ncbi:MAG: hypothetical protein PHF14_03250 [Verrucomicrobiota bacterium]|nr:hypothetical protein [Verrucomicrobiota bacterium]
MNVLRAVAPRPITFAINADTDTDWDTDFDFDCDFDFDFMRGKKSEVGGSL